MKCFALLLLLSSFLQSDKAVVYFYRVEEMPSLVNNKPKLRINGKPVAVFPEREYIGLLLPAGHYVLTLGQPQSATALVVESGKTYYVQVSFTLKGHGFNNLLDEIILRDEPQALLHFRQMKRVLEDKNIKTKNLGTLSAEVVRDRPQGLLAP